MTGLRRSVPAIFTGSVSSPSAKSNSYPRGWVKAYLVEGFCFEYLLRWWILPNFECGGLSEYSGARVYDPQRGAILQFLE